MSTIIFAQEVAKATGIKFNRLARLWIREELINQNYEDRGLTGFDTIIIATLHENDLLITFWVNTGMGNIPIAMAY